MKGDGLQAGGTFAVDQTGKTVFDHRQTTISDHPKISDILASLGITGAATGCKYFYCYFYCVFSRRFRFIFKFWDSIFFCLNDFITFVNLEIKFCEILFFSSSLFLYIYLTNFEIYVSYGVHNFSCLK